MTLAKEGNTPDKTKTDPTPAVSVIMNCLNGEKYLREAIDSVFAQTYEDWELIFWEDKDSTDSSGKIAKSYGNKLRHFKADEKLPLYGARNRAIEKAHGKYIAILDCDDIWLPSKLEKQIPILEKQSNVGLVYSDCIVFNEKGKKKRFFNIVRPERGMVFQKLLLSNFINTQTAVIRRSALESLGTFFDGRLHMSGDYDAYLRISHDWILDYVDEPLAGYRVHGSSMTTKDGRRLLANEIGLTMENLKKDIPDFRHRYTEGYNFLERRKNVQLGLLDWESGDKKLARQRVKRHARSSFAHMALYFLMLFPYKYVFNTFFRVYNKNLLAN